ncbi:MAG TPA: hypothetical protein VFT29_03795 [Gemmatimonadaceae bacterium]|nr:hypothetical protein [Gemmatimonadaceae bacterium]
MAGLRLDGAGQAKMNTIDDCVTIHQRIHGLVEQYALSVKQNKPAGHVLQNIKRQVPTLAAKLKGQFGMISDLVTSINMQMTRGSSEQMRVRTMREGMAAIKVQLEIAITQVIAKHAVKDEKQAAG